MKGKKTNTEHGRVRAWPILLSFQVSFTNVRKFHYPSWWGLVDIGLVSKQDMFRYEVGMFQKR